MAEALVSLVVEQLGSIMALELAQETRLVVGVENAVGQLTDNLNDIKAVLADAETKQVKEATVKNWIEKLKDVAYDIEDVLDDWEAAILSSQSKPGDEQDPKKPERKVCSFLRSSCFCCKKVGVRHVIARKIEGLNKRLALIAQERGHYSLVRAEVPQQVPQQVERPMTISMIDITEVKGRVNEEEVLVNMLLSESSNGNGPNIRVISLVGMGGLGKTTLAQLAFNHKRIEAYFDKKIWVCVSDPFDETRIAKAILGSLSGSTPSDTELENLWKEIDNSIKGKKILLVLDDVWEENSRKWDHFKQFLKFDSPKSKVLMTTRKENTALTIGCSKDDLLRVGHLSDDECWSIVKKIAFLNRSDANCNSLEDIGKEIAKKCKGLPLAAKALGGILQFRATREEWQNILDSEIWRMEEVQEDIFAPLWLSYYDLSPALKRCFSYCAIFPKDHIIEKGKLIELRMSQGYLEQEQSHNWEVKGENYFQNLAMRSFFQNLQQGCFDDRSIYSCQMHDMGA